MKAHPLVRTIRLNAAFSTLTGGFMLLNAQRVSAFIGIGAPWMYLLVGAGLLVFAADLVVHSQTLERAARKAVYFSIADIAWVIGSAILLITRPTGLQPHGTVAVVLVAIIVSVLAWFQLTAYRSLKRDASASTSDLSSSSRA